MIAPSFDAVRGEYRALWNGMVIRPAHDRAVATIAQRLVAAKARYQAVEGKTGVPWFVIAVIHERESSQSWHASLAQGDRWDRVSVHVPRGRGPFASWEEAAIDALKLEGFDKVTDWSLERTCYQLERYNGFGYRRHDIASPYLWSFSNQYRAGKFVADGKWSADAVDGQCGCMPMLHGMMLLDPSIRFGPKASVPTTPAPVDPPKEDKKIAPVTVAAAGAGAMIAFPDYTVPILVVLALASLAYVIWKLKGKK